MTPSPPVSKTPRTDAAFKEMVEGDCLPRCDSFGHEELCPYANGDAVMAEFARQLERELAQAQARCEELGEDAAKYRAMCQATISHVDGRDLLAELHPEAWHFCDIRVRINGRWREFEGDWLKRLLKARDTDTAFSREPHEQPDPNTLTMQGVEAGNMLVSMQGPPELLSGKPHK